MTRPGFSLLELLVVMAIIAILITLSVASVGPAHRAAADVQCLSNLRSLWRGLNAIESDGLLPMYEYTTAQDHSDWQNYQKRWADAMGLAAPVRLPEVPGSGTRFYTSAAPWRCPGDRSNVLRREDQCAWIQD